MVRLAAALFVPLLVAPACAGREPRAEPATARGPTPSPSPSVVVNPPGVVVENIALGDSDRRVRRAMRDLKEVDLWLPLTRHLFKVKFESRIGAVKIPEDGHLADALLTAGWDGNAQGSICHVMFFPNAISRDLERWRFYYEQGATIDEPPTLRHLWAGVMAHELAHCFPGGKGEKVAERWERKTLDRLKS